MEHLGKEVRTRKSEVLERESSIKPTIPRPRSYSFAIGGRRITMPHLRGFGEDRSKVNADASPHLDWSFASYAFNLSPDAKEIKRPDILDVIHFCHYANMAYVQLDNEIQKKTDVLLHFSPLNDLFQAPYMVSVDHDWNSIVIAIRGTYSAADVLVDLSIDTAILDPELEEAEKYKVHAGFFQTAKNIFEDIRSNQILEKTIGNANTKEAHYHIVVCGHSLGAGVASLVAYMLRKHGFPSTKCYGYSMPSGVANEHASTLFNDFCLSVVCGDDSVSRLTLASCDVLKNDITRLISNCNLPKYKIFGSALTSRLQCLTKPESRKSLLLRTQNGLFPDGVDVELQESEINRIILNTGSLPKKWRQIEGKTAAFLQTAFSSTYEPMFIPGRILYIEKLRVLNPRLVPKVVSPEGEVKRKRGLASMNAMTEAIKERVVIAQHKSFDCKYVYTPRWASKEEFMEMIVSRTMISDHNAIFPIMREFYSTHPHVPLQVLS
ncbi:hypothetical protein HDU91_003035 [Kappamyces sp. JEL0680]|nr:hypothetical protein HDU91_003035 [Kappamyces sp. JEL0680]